MWLFEGPVLPPRMRGLYCLFTFLMIFKNFLFLRKTISSRVKHVQIVDAHGDMAWSLLKFRFFWRMFHILEKWLLEAPRHIAVDSPKHCKGCKIKTWISRGSTPYRFYFLDFATLTRFWSCSTWHKNSCLESNQYKATRFKGSNLRQLHTLIKSGAPV